MGDPSPNDPPWLTAARADLKAQRFEQLAEALRAANATSWVPERDVRQRSTGTLSSTTAQ